MGRSGPRRGRAPAEGDRRGLRVRVDEPARLRIRREGVRPALAGAAVPPGSPRRGRRDPGAARAAARAWPGRAADARARGTARGAAAGARRRGPAGRGARRADPRALRRAPAPGGGRRLPGAGRGRGRPPRRTGRGQGAGAGASPQGAAGRRSSGAPAAGGRGSGGGGGAAGRASRRRRRAEGAGAADGRGDRGARRCVGGSAVRRVRDDAAGRRARRGRRGVLRGGPAHVAPGDAPTSRGRPSAAASTHAATTCARWRRRSRRSGGRPTISAIASHPSRPTRCWSAGAAPSPWTRSPRSGHPRDLRAHRGRGLGARGLLRRRRRPAHRQPVDGDRRPDVHGDHRDGHRARQRRPGSSGDHRPRRGRAERGVLGDGLRHALQGPRAGTGRRGVPDRCHLCPGRRGARDRRARRAAERRRADRRDRSRSSA